MKLKMSHIPLNVHRNKSLTAVAQATSNEDRSILWREWLDTFYLACDQTRLAMLEEEPPFTDTFWDALFAAGVAWLAHKMHHPAPLWAKHVSRRLKFPYWRRSDPTSLTAICDRARAPAEFYSRNLYIGPEIMLRARTPEAWLPRPLQWEIELGKEILAYYSKKHCQTNS